MTREAIAVALATSNGLVQLRTARSTGTTVGVYRSAAADLDASTPWCAVCEDHGAILGCSSRKLAAVSATQPEEWCEDCAGTKEPS